VTKLAAFTSKMEIFSIKLSKMYRIREFYDDLIILYAKLCKKPTVFLFTDSHVKDEGFLEAINNMLTIGLVPAIFAQEDVR
jgi:dynein heavy chain